MDPILFYLTVPPIMFVAFLIAHELKLFRMAIVIVLAAIAALAEQMEKRWRKAAKEI